VIGCRLSSGTAQQSISLRAAMHCGKS
jgi:hypothetical protein